jgi:hypothetical protein
MGRDVPTTSEDHGGDDGQQKGGVVVGQQITASKQTASDQPVSGASTTLREKNEERTHAQRRLLVFNSRKGRVNVTEAVASGNPCMCVRG